MSSAANTDEAGRPDRALGPAAAPELLKALTAHTPVGVFVSARDGACVYVNDCWCALAGLGFLEALGDGWAAALHPDDRDRVAAEWEAASAAGRDSVVEYRFLRPDGSVAWVKGYATAVTGPDGLLGWVGTCLDLTEYRTAEQELTNERETFRAAFDDAPTGMALVSPTGRFLRVNRALCTIAGYPGDELLRLTFQDITHPDDLDADVELVERLLGGEINSYRLEKRYVRRDGSPYWMSMSASLIRDELREPLHFVVHVEDIHERKLAERLLRRQADHDALTGLLNRRRLVEELELRLEQVAHGSLSADLILIDVDRFKLINDSFGHAAGDRVLVAAGGALERRLRRVDVLARLGGDEFAVIVETGGEAASGDRVAEDLLAEIRACDFGADAPGGVTASAGVASLVAGQSADGTLEAADRALYRAKQAGRDRVERER